MASEERLINAGPLLDHLYDTVREMDWLVSQFNADWVYSMIENAPKVDAVEVVRCANCGNYDPGNGTCMIRFDERGEPLGVLSTGYCSDGERRVSE